MNSLEKEIQFFTDLAQSASTVQILPQSEFVANLHSRAQDLAHNNFPQTPVYEFLPDTQKWSKFYYDLDVKDETLPPDPEFWVEHLTNCFSITPNQVASICQTPWTAACPKLSLHITLNYKGTRTEIKNSAMKLRRYLSAKIPDFDPNWVDLQVYGKTQKWRCIYSSKRGQNRFKIPIYGDIVSSLVSVIDGLTAWPARVVPDDPSTSRMRWLDHALQRPELADLWAEKRNNYGKDGFLIGGSLYLEGAIHRKYLPEARRVFNLFAGGTNAIASEQVFEQRFMHFEKEQWNKIHKWVRDAHPTVSKYLEPVWSGAVHRILSDIRVSVPEDIGESDERDELPPKFETKIEFILSQHITRSAAIRNFWEIKLRDRELDLIEALLLHDRIGKYRSALKSCFDSFGHVNKEALPFGYLRLDNQEFKQWFLTYMTCPLTFEAAQISADLAKKAWDEYCLVCRELDERLFFAVEKEAVGVHMLAPKERSKPSELIRMICQGESRYEMQFPYQPLFKALEAASGGINDLFWIALSKYNGSLLECEKKFHFLTQPHDDDTAARIVIDLYPFWRLSPTNELYVYDDAEGFWSSSDGVQKSVISRMVAFLEQPLGDKGASRNLASSLDCRSKVWQSLRILETLRIGSSADFRVQQKSAFGRLLYRNGYYDAIQETFYERKAITLYGQEEKFFCHPQLMFFSKINNDYEDLKPGDMPMFEEMLKVLFYDVHGKTVGDFWLCFLAMALLAETRLKKQVENVSDHDGGKSSLVSFLLNAFGNYVSSGTMADFARTGSDFRSNGRQNGFLVTCWFSRLRVITELNDHKQVLNSQKLKNFVSGGLDMIQASLLRADDAAYDVHFLLSFFVNSPLVFDQPNDTAMQSRRWCITWFKTFKKPHEYTDPSSQMLAIPEVEFWAKDKKRQLIFNHLVIQSFQAIKRKGYEIDVPLSIQQSTEIMQEPDYSVKEKVELLLQYVQITGDAGHSVPMEDLKRICKDQMDLPNTTKALTQIAEHVQSLGVHFKTGVQVRTNAKRIQVCTGIYARGHSTGAQDFESFTDYKSWSHQIHAYEIKMIPEHVIARLEAITTSTVALNENEDSFIREFGSERQLLFLAQHNPHFRRIKPRVVPVDVELCSFP